MTTTTPIPPPVAPPAAPVAPAVRLDGTAPSWAVPITSRYGRTTRTLGVVLVDASGARWQRTPDIERLAAIAAIAAAAAGAVAVQGLLGATLRRPAPRVEQITMGPGGWVSFRGGEKPTPRGQSRRRPWWAVLLRARPLER
jgi:hypothetical protein